MKNLHIKNDIQSLRGLSVLLIFLFHFDQVFFKYFYVGVDIFFIISGYVITSSIFNTIYKNNYNIFYYFLKRIKRIYPALIFFIIFFNIIFFSLIKFSDGEYFEIIFSSITSILGISNYYYILDPNLDYFDDKLKWLQHTWSLSNEIQFYIFLGLLIFVVSKFTNLKQNSNSLITILIIVSLISLYFFIFSDNKIFSNYYSSLSRLWEFFIGSLAYLLKFEKFKNKKLNFNLTLYLFICLLFLINFITDTINYRFIIIFTALLVTFGTFFTNKDNLSKVNKIFIFYGNISFSFFLWHLPIISIVKVYNDYNLVNFFISFILTSIIAFLSYIYIEIKFNKKSKLDLQLISIFKLVFSLLFIISIVFSLNKQYIDQTRDFLYKKIIKVYPIITKLNNAQKDRQLNDNWILQYDKCENENENFSWSLRVNCLEEKGFKNLFYLVGNSYTDHIVPTFSFFSRDSSIYKSRFENCYIFLTTNKCDDKSAEIIDNFNKISTQFEKKYLVLSLNGRNISLEKLSKNLDNISKITKIIFIYSHPNVKTFKNEILLKKYNNIKDQDFNKLEILSKKYKIAVFDTHAFLCGENLCNENNYNSFFTDGSHFTIKTSNLLSVELKRLIF